MRFQIGFLDWEVIALELQPLKLPSVAACRIMLASFGFFWRIKQRLCLCAKGQLCFSMFFIASILLHLARFNGELKDESIFKEIPSYHRKSMFESLVVKAKEAEEDAEKALMPLLLCGFTPSPFCSHMFAL
jgi:phosphatidylserine synthase